MEAAQLRDHFLGQAVAEILLIGIAGQVLEWQHRQPDRGLTLAAEVA